MVVIICGKYGNNRSRTENVTGLTWFSKSRSNDLEDMGQGQRSSHATHLLMLVFICTKYGKNPSRTVDAIEGTRFQRPRPNDLEDIGQGQRSLYATHPLILVIICSKYGKNPSRTVDFLAATKQLYEWFSPSVRPSVRLSVRHTFLTRFLSTYHHEIFRSYYQWQKWRPCKRSRSEVKGQGHRGHDPT